MKGKRNFFKKTMNQKGFSNILVIILALVVVAGLAGYFMFFQKQKTTPTTTIATSEAKALVGIWQSTQDSKFTREFRVDGSVIDKYEGDEKATSIGTWYHIIYPERESFDFSGFGSNATFIKLVLDGEPFYFEVLERTENSLTLIYLVRGNLLHFTRVK